MHWFATGLQAFEQRLASEPQTGVYCHGNTPTMADICLASIILVVLSHSHSIVNWRGRALVERGPRSNFGLMVPTPMPSNCAASRRSSCCFCQSS